MSTEMEQHKFPCEQCGADLRFDPGQGQLICDHCGHTQELTDRSNNPWGSTTLREMDFKTALDGRLPEVDLEETRVLNCSNCGAQVEFEPGIHAAECPFCATPVVTDTGISRHIKPKGLLPFAMDQNAAKSAMTDWLGRLWFAPSGLADYARKGRRLDGIYVPYWTFDARTRSRYTGQHGTVYYETRTVRRDGKLHTERVAKVRWRSARGQVARMFDDVLVLASRSLPRKFTDGLMPWDLSQLEPYAPEYLAGLRAEAYMIELDEAFGTARAEMDRTIERDVRFDIGGDRQRVTSIDTQVSDVTFKHVLLPIWVAAYRYNGKSYRFVVNGQTGRVQGERPYSVWKIAAAVIVGLLIAGGIAYVNAISQ
ncbi:TFIIB-type zinc finger domain-containing protein [Pseudoruegeria sp. SK021]|uniref:TFIIB-type zinc finger domain-containing protein n=1 Tax=Pseudoruegeria sp. SK021 TaxID=1933035 RepID=UPI000A222AF0|nr:TFIIB-type zinc finger domain-containing protein [Pseudoruegeria sp. SK021]OSP54976.1 primosomal protein N' (replication factor Y) - superfamily II helicase [Pseudoruegeria sp. SK021]